MNLALLLHFYQPATQQIDILDRIVNECYIPLTTGLLNTPKGKIIANVSGSLTELLLKNKYDTVIENMILLAKRGQLEFTSTAMHHPILPLLPDDEVIRQISLNDSYNKNVFGDVYEPVGFFSPEMAVSDSVLNVVSRLGYEWIACPELSIGNIPYTSSNRYVSSGLSLHFRDKRTSSLILSSMCKNAVEFMKEAVYLDNEAFSLCVMDAETFGHHRIGHEKFLFDVLGNENIKSLLSVDLRDMLRGSPEVSVNIRPCTWTNTEQDFWMDSERSINTEINSFILWKDPTNPIHTLQWQLFNFVVDKIRNYSNKDSPNWLLARRKLDAAVGSDQFWWASAKPWWSLEMIELGAYELKNVLITLGEGLQDTKYVESLYHDILDKAFEWQRTGYIRKRNLDNSSTYKKASFKQRTPPEWFNQVLLEFEDEMHKCEATQNYEKAIMWRDAILKVSNETDIYDVLHVVDELWTARNLPSVKPFLSHTWDELSPFLKKHFQGIKTQKDFDEWKSKRGFK